MLIDEPENHLHPSLQRALLPGLVKAFPQAQFIAATHNPFVVTSVQESNVVVLDFVDGRVESTQLKDEEVDRSATVNQVLTDVLGVPFPAPLWVEHRTGPYCGIGAGQGAERGNPQRSEVGSQCGWAWVPCSLKLSIAFCRSTTVRVKDGRSDPTVQRLRTSNPRGEPRCLDRRICELA